jgi:hypothetical protein
LRFCGVHIGDPPPNQATTFESQQIQGIQYVFGQTLRAVKGDKATAHAIFEDYLAGKLSEELLSISRRCVSADQAGASKREVEEGLGGAETIKSGRSSGVGDDAFTALS